MAAALASSSLAAPAQAAGVVFLDTRYIATAPYTTTVLRPDVRGLPRGAQVVKAVIRVKRGSTVLAENVTSKRVGLGQYRVLSTITYRPRITRQVPVVVTGAQCRVATRQIIDDRTTTYLPNDPSGWRSGQVTVRYTGSCTAYDANYRSISVMGTWTEDPFVIVDLGQSLLTASSIHKARDVAYVDRGSFTRAVISYGSNRVGYYVTPVFVAKVLFG